MTTKITVFDRRYSIALNQNCNNQRIITNINLIFFGGADKATAASTAAGGKGWTSRVRDYSVTVVQIFDFDTEKGLNFKQKVGC